MTTQRLTIERHTHLGGASHEGPLSECREHSHRYAESRTIEVRTSPTERIAFCAVDGCTWWRDVATDEPEPYAVNSGLEHDTPGTGLVPFPEEVEDRGPRNSLAPFREDDGFMRCESGWTNDRCYFRLGHEGPHSNAGPEDGR